MQNSLREGTYRLAWTRETRPMELALLVWQPGTHIPVWTQSSVQECKNLINQKEGWMHTIPTKGSDIQMKTHSQK